MIHDPRRLRQGRLRARISVAELARRSRYSASHIRGLEKGMFTASPECLAHVARVLGKDPVSLLADDQRNPTLIAELADLASDLAAALADEDEDTTAPQAVAS